MQTPALKSLLWLFFCLEYTSPWCTHGVSLAPFMTAFFKNHLLNEAYTDLNLQSITTSTPHSQSPLPCSTFSFLLGIHHHLICYIIDLLGLLLFLLTIILECKVNPRHVNQYPIHGKYSLNTYWRKFRKWSETLMNKLVFLTKMT